MNIIDKFHHWRRKIRWNKQYRNGRWDSLESEKEVKRYQKIIDFINTYAPENPSIMDIGSGDGVLTLRMQEVPYAYFLGLDFSKVSIEKAQARNFPNTDFKTADAILYEPDQKFDVIVFNEAFYYIPDTKKQEVLDRMIASLTHNGIIITSIFREGEGCWEFFKNNATLKEKDFTTVYTNEKKRYWKVGVYSAIT